MEAFEALLNEQEIALQRFVHFKISDWHAAEDVLQETRAAAASGWPNLKNREAFKGWLLGIARNKCADYYRRKAKQLDIPLEALECKAVGSGLYGRSERNAVLETLELLGDTDKRLLYLYYFRQLPQDQIAYRLQIPLGTVKSRLHYARQRFKQRYPYPPKGEKNMKKMPEYIPDYTITPSNLPPFSVRWEEVMGWFIVPRLGEKCTWAMYDFPERRKTETCEMAVIGRAQVHGLEGVEITSVEADPMECNSAGGQKQVERRFVAQLTDTHCRLLAESHTEDGVRRCFTFLDGDDFLNNWGFGEDNCGNEIDIRPKGEIVRRGSEITTAQKEFLLDVVGRYTVTINGKTYDTVCVMDCYTYIEGAASEQFIDRNGRTVLWRRFNRDDWAIDRYGKPWSQQLPDNERLCINGLTYVHWYDCITDYIL